LVIWSIKAKGKIFADIGASKALLDGKSLLAAGVTKANGSFDKGDTLVIFNDKNIEIARGLSNYNSEDLNKIIGKKSKEIEVILGYVDKPEIIHRNNLVYSGEQES
jgi:glutamate 5-kinase